MTKRAITEYRLTEHARLEMKRRRISEADVAAVLSAPEQTVEVRPGRVVCQSRVRLGAPVRVLLLRVFVDTDRRPAEVVTAYRTSRVGKYWRAQS
jgi:hypothetical protein